MIFSLFVTPQLAGWYIIVCWYVL